MGKLLRTWEEVVNAKKRIPGSELTDIMCPECGQRIYKRKDIVLTCYPPKYQYYCVQCNWVGCAE